MANKYTDLCSVIMAVCVLPILVQSAPERRLIDQINNLRGDLTHVFYDISTLYKSVESINKTLLSKDCENPVTRSKDVDEDGITGDGKLSDGFGYAEIKALIEAFASEKRLNRQLQNQLNDVKNGIESEQMAIRRVEEKLETVENLADLFKAEIFQLNKQHQRELDEIKDGISRIQKNIVDNVTTIIEISDCQCKQTTSGTTDPSKEQQEITTTTEVQTPQSCEGMPTGVHDINLNSLQSAKTIYCENDVDGGGWIVILRRQDGSVDFNRNWTDYKNGFGDINGEFWIGNDFIHELTKFKPRELRIDMENEEGNKAFAKYGVFKVGSEAEKYVLTVGGYSGTAGDAMVETIYDEALSNDGMRFTTIDADNDHFSSENCAIMFGGGWWFNDCSASCLTSYYSVLTWENWMAAGSEFITCVEMKLR